MHQTTFNLTTFLVWSWFSSALSKYIHILTIFFLFKKYHFVSASLDLKLWQFCPPETGWKATFYRKRRQYSRSYIIAVMLKLGGYDKTHIKYSSQPSRTSCGVLVVAFAPWSGGLGFDSLPGDPSLMVSNNEYLGLTWLETEGDGTKIIPCGIFEIFKKKKKKVHAAPRDVPDSKVPPHSCWVILESETLQRFQKWDKTVILSESSPQLLCSSTGIKPLWMKGYYSEVIWKRRKILASKNNEQDLTALTAYFVLRTTLK